MQLSAILSISTCHTSLVERQNFTQDRPSYFLGVEKYFKRVHDAKIITAGRHMLQESLSYCIPSIRWYKSVHENLRTGGLVSILSQWQSPDSSPPRQVKSAVWNYGIQTTRMPSDNTRLPGMADHCISFINRDCFGPNNFF